MRIREDAIRFADGSPGTYTVIEKGDFALVIAYEDGGFWLVQQYRYPLGEREWEFVQGGWPDGRSGSPEELAALELREETGLRAARLAHLGRLHAAPGYANNSFDVFVATGLTPGEPQREPTEADMVHAFVAEDELERMLGDGRFRDSNSVAALALFDRWRGRR